MHLHPQKTENIFYYSSRKLGEHQWKSKNFNSNRKWVILFNLREQNNEDKEPFWCFLAVPMMEVQPPPPPVEEDDAYVSLVLFFFSPPLVLFFDPFFPTSLLPLCSRTSRGSDLPFLHTAHFCKLYDSSHIPLFASLIDLEMHKGLIGWKRLTNEPGASSTPTL